jgi:hypothetical protein
VPSDDLISPAPPPKLKALVYIDGFNLYYGVLKENPAWRWLNIQVLFDELRLNDDIIGIRYFTAIVDEGKQASTTRDRQKRYLKALGSLERVEIILGKYQSREVTCRATCKKEYLVPEEKKTDVNIAVRMISDAVDCLAERLILVSGDSDLEPAVAWIKKRVPNLKLTVYIPQLPSEAKTRRNDAYRQMGVDVRVLPVDRMAAHQFPQCVTLANGGTVERPAEWPKGGAR